MYMGDGKPPINPNQSYDVPPPGLPPGDLPPRPAKNGGLFNKINPFHK